MNDYYETLGIKRDATEIDIKNAYRKLAKDHHPDKGGDTETFQKIQEAYSVLSDPNRKREYDTPKPHSFPFEFNIHHFMNNQQRNAQTKRQDNHYNCKINLRDCFFGTVKKLRLQRERLCEKCLMKCNVCNGTGNAIRQFQLGFFAQTIQEPCIKCSGRGSFLNKQASCVCTDGQLKEIETLELEIKRNVSNNTRHILEGWGEQSKRIGEIPGNLIVTITIENDESFSRIGNDLVYNTKLTLNESITNKTIVIPHYDGNIVIETKGFGIISPNKTYTIYNKGMVLEDESRGHLHLKFQIDYPDKSLSDSEITKLKNILNEVGI